MKEDWRGYYYEKPTTAQLSGAGAVLSSGGATNENVQKIRVGSDKLVGTVEAAVGAGLIGLDLLDTPVSPGPDVGIAGATLIGRAGARAIEREAPLELNAAVRLTEKGVAHVTERHTVNDIAKFAGKSKFNQGEDLPALIEGGTQQRAIQQVNGNYARTWDTGRKIGVDQRTGRQTSIMTVITRANGELVTAFPGSP